MTICVENGRVERAPRGRVYRQKSFDMLQESAFFEDSSSLETVTEDSGDSNASEKNPMNFYASADNAGSESSRSCDSLRRTLSVESIASRRKKRSSLILNWLRNPENKVMYQGRHIDSKIFRSHSAVESRTCGNFTKSTRCHSLREQEIATRGSGKSSISRQNGWICELEIPRDNCASLTCSKVPVVTNDIIDVDVPCSLEQVNGCDQGATPERHQDTVNKTQFQSFSGNKMDDKDDLLLNFRELNLKSSKRDDAGKTAIDMRSHKKARSFNSLPNYGRSQQVKLRRMNSDALFYTGGRRNSDKQNTFDFRRRNHLSLQLRSRLEKERVEVDVTARGEEISSGTLVTSPDFLNNIEKIFTSGDLEVIQRLAECGFDFNAKDDSGNCALHYAALRGSEKIITEILENGGNVWVRNNDNQLPVELASNINVRMLLSGVTLFYRGQYSNEIESRLTSKQMSFEL